MKTLPALAINTLLLLFLAGLNACVPAVRLSAPELPPAQTQIGSVALGNINNLRPQNTGGKDFSLIGEVRSGYGRPFPLQTEEGRELDTAIREAVRSALDHAGYYALTPALPGDLPRLDVDVISFWGDGHEGYQIEAIVVIKLVEPGGDNPLIQREVNLNRDFSVTAGYGSLQRAFAGIMQELQRELLAFMGSEPFRTAVRQK